MNVVATAQTEVAASVEFDLGALVGTTNSPGEGDQVGGLVYAFEPVTRFLAELKRLIHPATARARVFQDDDGDTYVEIDVPDREWARYLGRQIAVATGAASPRMSW